MVQKYEWSMLILRVILGITFLIHGLAKFQMGLGNVAGWFESIGIIGFLGYVVAIIELFGGIALIIGLGTKVVSALLAIVMLGAIFTTKLSAGFMGNGQMAGYELDVALLAISIVLFISGSKLYALENKLLGPANETTDKKVIA